MKNRNCVNDSLLGHYKIEQELMNVDMVCEKLKQKLDKKEYISIDGLFQVHLLDVLVSPNYPRRQSNPHELKLSKNFKEKLNEMGLECKTALPAPNKHYLYLLLRTTPKNRSESIRNAWNDFKTSMMKE